MFYNIVEWIILLQVACFCTLKVKAVSRTNIILVQKFKENDEPERSKENKNTLHSYEEKNTYNPHIPFQYCGLFFFLFRIYNDM